MQHREPHLFSFNGVMFNGVLGSVYSAGAEEDERKRRGRSACGPQLRPGGNLNTQDWDSFQVTQPHLVAANSSGIAILTCDYKYSKQIVELKIYLLRARHNDTISCETSVNESKKGSLCLMECYENSVTLTISRLNVSDADLYVCRVEIRSPPPFVYAEGTGTIVYVAETSQIPLPQCTDFNWPVVWINAGVSGLLLLYSIVITLTCLCLKKRNTVEPESNSEYMDMRKVMSENTNRNRKRDRNHNSEQFHF